MLMSNVSFATGQELDGTLKIKSRLVSTGIGLSWGDGVLIYKGQDHPFTFQAKGLFRDVDAHITAAELSGRVFNLTRLEIFNGTYHKVDALGSDASAGTRARIKNQNGVVVDLVSTMNGRKFTLGPDGMSIELKKQKP